MYSTIIVLLRAPWPDAYQTAITRAGPPEPPACFGAPSALASAAREPSCEASAAVTAVTAPSLTKPRRLNAPPGLWSSATHMVVLLAGYGSAAPSSLMTSHTSWSRSASTSGRSRALPLSWCSGSPARLDEPARARMPAMTALRGPQWRSPRPLAAFDNQRAASGRDVKLGLTLRQNPRPCLGAASPATHPLAVDPRTSR